MIADLLNNNPLFVFAIPEEATGEFSGPDLLFTGVGKRQAAYQLTKKISQSRPGIIINLGSAGSFHYNRDQVICCTKFIERDMDATALGFQKYKTPFAEEEPVLSYGLKAEGLPEAICGSGDCFEINHSSDDYHVVDMEAYSLAWVCKQEGIPFLCLKYITDGADGKAAEDWHNSVHKAAAALKQVITRISKNI